MDENKSPALLFVCPECRCSLDIPGRVDENAVVPLICAQCKASYQIVRGISRFVPIGTYADSFGFQWNQHARTQLDSCSGTTITRDRFLITTEWPSKLPGETVLEAGCGAGRFTEIIAQTGASVFAFDLSTAIDVNKSNNGRFDNVTFFHADILKIPLPYESFDRVVSLGVIQHTPHPKSAFMSLINFLKPGGHFACDIYDLETHRLPHPKYLLRPIAKRLPSKLLYRLIADTAPLLLPVKRKLRLSSLGLPLSRLIPIYDYSGVLNLSAEQLLQWGILDTFDGLAAWHEHPQSVETVWQWCAEAKLVDVFVGPGPNGINVRGRRASQS